MNSKEKERQSDATKDFVKDKYFEGGNFLLKLRQTLVTLAFWWMIIFPLLTLINSVSRQRIWRNIYRWTWADGLILARDLFIMVILSLLVFIIIGGFFLLRNNRNLKKIIRREKHTMKNVLRPVVRFWKKLILKDLGIANFVKMSIIILSFLKKI